MALLPLTTVSFFVAVFAAAEDDDEEEEREAVLEKKRLLNKGINVVVCLASFSLCFLSPFYASMLLRRSSGNGRMEIRKKVERGRRERGALCRRDFLFFIFFVLLAFA